VSNFQRELDLALALAEAKAERDAARADADRLAAALTKAVAYPRGIPPDCDVSGALAAHDAARPKEGP